MTKPYCLTRHLLNQRFVDVALAIIAILGICLFAAEPMHGQMGQDMMFQESSASISEADPGELRTIGLTEFGAEAQESVAEIVTDTDSDREEMDSRMEAPPQTIPSVEKYVTATITVHNGEQLRIAREAGIDDLVGPGQEARVEIPADLAEFLRDHGLDVLIIDRFLDVKLLPGEEKAGVTDEESQAQNITSRTVGCTNYVYAVNDTGVDVPDDPDDCNTGSSGYAYLSTAVTDTGTVCSVEYRMWMSHTYPGDMVLQLNNSYHPVRDGQLIWDRDGAGTDGGLDDDAADDDDIYLNWRVTNFFNGDPVNGTWYLDAWDNCPGDTGHINYIEFRIYYADDPDISVEPTSLKLNCEDGAVAEDSRSMKGGITGQETSSLRAAGKLIDADAIYEPFDKGENTTHVIVSLFEPEQTRSSTNFDDANSLAVLQADVSARQDQVLLKLNANELELRYRYQNQAGFSGHVTREGLEKLLNDPMVQFIEPVYELQESTNQGIPLMNALTTRPTYNGSGISIAICDTGIDYTHPRLGNGGFPNTKVIGGIDVGDNDTDPMPPGSAHGTACAGIAAGNTGTVGDYIGGVAYNAKLYAVKIAYEGTGSATTAAMIAGWDWCITHKNDDPSNPILVISTSFGGSRFYSACDSESPSMTAAADNAVAAGITVLSSSGNDGFCDSMQWPACISSVISVGAVYDANFGTYYPCVSSGSCATKYPTGGCSSGWYAIDNTAADMVTSYSNTASFLDILAPANQAYTCDIVGAGGYEPGDYDPTFGGTSAACPYAAGAVAAMQSASMDRTGAYLTPAQVRSKLIATGFMITDDKVAITKPKVDLGNAIDTIDCAGQYFRIQNDGGGTLTVSSISGVPSWLTINPAPPYNIPAGGSQAICVEVDCGACDGTDLHATLRINSNDPSNPVTNLYVTMDCEEMGVCCLFGEGECVPGVCGSFETCNGNSNCVCAIDSDGGGTCAWAFSLCPPIGTPCTDGSECGNGEFCWLGSCCGEGVCASLCPDPTTAVPEIEDGMMSFAGGGGPYDYGTSRSNCIQASASDCAAWNGAYWGDDTSCDTITCPDCDNALIHVATDENIGYSDGTLVDHPLTRGNPDKIVIATSNWNPGGLNPTWNDAPIGVYYSGSYDDWTIFNEDFDDMLEGMSFNVEVLDPSDAAFTHVATAANIIGNYTVIDHPLTNDHPEAILLVTQNLTPSVVRNPSPIGVWYSSSREKWTIFNEDTSAMPVNAAFNVEVLPEAGPVFKHVATSANINSNYTLIDNALTNDNPSAIILVTQNLNEGGAQYNNAPIGVWYYSYVGQWGIFNEDNSDMPEDAGFNVKVASECYGVDPVQACCFFDGSCGDITADVCSAMGGTPQGTGSTCATTTCTQCECDLNTDGRCDMQDWLLFGADWGRTDCGTPPGSGDPPNDCECDLNTDGKCDMQDWLLFGEDWGRTDCPTP